MPDAVLFQTDGPVCTILLNRPECRNAVDGPTAADLLAAFERFEALPIALEEAAQLDGAGRLYIFFNIVLPLAGPGLTAGRCKKKM